MGGMTSMLHSGAVEAVAGSAVSSVVSSIAGKYEMQEGLDATLFRLQQEVIKIQCAINAARARQIRDPKLLEWLALLINAAYHGNFYHRTFKRKKTCHPKIESEALLNVHPERPVKTYIYMDQNRLLNRDKETEYVVKFLLEPSWTGTNNVDILPIVGDSAVGKTSLVLHCFYKSHVQNHFSRKIFISYPTICGLSGGVHSIFEQILEQCHNPNDITNADEHTRVVMLKQNLSSERFLLVMDNFWGVDPLSWNLLLECLRCGKHGSKVIFTSDRVIYTKFHNIAKAGTMTPLMLAGFSEEEYTTFFMEHAFGSADPEDFPDLIRIGREIEQKMNGSMWGAKILGELLRDNLNANFWSMFLQHSFSDSDFLCGHDLSSVCDIISRILLKRPDVHNVVLTDVMLTSYAKWRGKSLSHELKSFRELMVLGPTYYTPLIKNQKDYEVPFLVTEYFNLRHYVVVVALCKLTCNESKILLGEIPMYIDGAEFYAATFGPVSGRMFNFVK